MLPALPWFELTVNWLCSENNPWANAAAPNGAVFSVYGREIAYKWGDVALWMCTSQNAGNKQTAAYQIIQCGLDIAGYLDGGGEFYHDGGHRLGRKFPVVFAAAALNDATLLGKAGDPTLFQEDMCTWFVTEADVGRAVVAPKVTYNAGHVGMAEWGVRHLYEPEQDDSRWGGEYTPYRFANWPASMGGSFAAQLMGLEDVWNHPPIFAYSDRFVSVEGVPSWFLGAMWTAYSDYEPPTESPTAPSSASAAPFRQTGFDLSWTDNSDNETGFIVEWSYDGGSTWPYSATVAANVTSYSNRSQPAGTTITPRVRATNGAGDSSNATSGSITTAAPAPVGRVRGAAGGIGGGL
jgi:hypothetical protein